PKLRELSVRLDRLSLFVPREFLEDGLRAPSRVCRRLAKQDRRLASRLRGDLPRLRERELLLKRVTSGAAVRTIVRHRLRLGDEAAHVALGLRVDVDRIDARHHGGVLRAGPGDALQPRELVLLVAAEFFEGHLDPHLSDRHIGEVVERQPFHEGAESPCEGVRFLPTFGGQVPGHPQKPCRPLDTAERISRFATAAAGTALELRCPSRTASSRSRTSYLASTADPRRCSPSPL